MLKVPPELPVEEPKIVGLTKIVICAECHTIQAWDTVQQKKRCTAEELSRGWRKCQSDSFYEVAA